MCIRHSWAVTRGNAVTLLVLTSSCADACQKVSGNTTTSTPRAGSTQQIVAQRDDGLLERRDSVTTELGGSRMQTDGRVIIKVGSR